MEYRGMDRPGFHLSARSWTLVRGSCVELIERLKRNGSSFYVFSLPGTFDAPDYFHTLELSCHGAVIGISVQRWDTDDREYTNVVLSEEFPSCLIAGTDGLSTRRLRVLREFLRVLRDSPEAFVPVAPEEILRIGIHG
jgi:hypothetical protein